MLTAKETIALGDIYMSIRRKDSNLLNIVAKRGVQLYIVFGELRV